MPILGWQENPLRSVPQESILAWKFWLNVGSTLAVVLALWTGSNRLPLWAVWVIAIWAGIGIVSALANPTINAIRSILTGFSKRRWANILLPEMHSCVLEFEGLLDWQKANRFQYFIQEICNFPEIQSLPGIPDGDFFETFRCWINSIKLTLESRKALPIFPLISREFFLSVFRYHRRMVCTHAIFENLIDQKKISDEQKIRKIKRDWDVCLGSHRKFIEKMENLDRGICNTYGENYHILIGQYNSLQVSTLNGTLWTWKQGMLGRCLRWPRRTFVGRR